MKQAEIESILENLQIDYNADKEINLKIKNFTKCSYLFVTLACFGSFFLIIFPMSLGSLPFKIWFPLDWKHNRIFYWITAFYCIMSYIFSIVTAVYFRLFVWFLLYNASLQYQLLGKRLKNLSQQQLEGISCSDKFVECITSQQKLTE